MEKVRPWCGRPSDRGRLKNRTDLRSHRSSCRPPRWAAGTSSENFSLFMSLSLVTMHAVLKNSSLGSSGAQNPRQFLSDLRDFFTTNHGPQTEARGCSPVARDRQQTKTFNLN